MKNNNYKLWKITATVLIVIGSIGCTNKKPDSQTNTISKKSSQNIAPVQYKIQKVKDLSSPIPIPGTNPIKTATKKKIQYFIILGNSVNKEQVKSTVDKVLNEIRKEDPEVDEVILELCSTIGVASYGTGDIGQAIWAPKGELGNVTAEIAQNDLRDNYSLSLEIKDNLEEYLEKERNTIETEKYGLTLKKRKEIYRALVSAEDKGIMTADRMYSIGSSKHSQAEDRLMEKYKRQVREKYGISAEVADKISVEGFEKRWPQPEFNE